MKLRADNPQKATAVHYSLWCQFCFWKNETGALFTFSRAQSSLFLFAPQPFGNLSLIYSSRTAHNAY
jgi:hypothetical protein